MCLAVPMKVLEIQSLESAIADSDGVRRRVNVSLVPGVSVGDYVIVHAGFAIEMLNVAEAEERIKLFAEIGSAPMLVNTRDEEPENAMD